MPPIGHYVCMSRSLDNAAWPAPAPSDTPASSFLPLPLSCTRTFTCFSSNSEAFGSEELDRPTDRTRTTWKETRLQLGAKRDLNTEGFSLTLRL